MCNVQSAEYNCKATRAHPDQVSNFQLAAAEVRPLILVQGDADCEHQKCKDEYAAANVGQHNGASTSAGLTLHAACSAIGLVTPLDAQ